MTHEEKIRQPGVFMQWSVLGDGNPFVYFEEKYGFKPTQIAIGTNVDIEVPEGVEIVDNVMVQDKHIKLR
jgi:hypothetical protein